MEHGPALPAYILRGHDAAVHAIHFYAGNSLLASGDSDGWLVIWSLSSKRPLAVWKAHDSGILHLHHWTDHRLISHGRDHKLRVWQVRPESLAGLPTALPSESSRLATDPAQPWLLHSLSVNALNFCAFSICDEDGPQQATDEPRPRLIASPNGLDPGGIDIFQLPSERRLSQISSDKNSPTGMVMALSLSHQGTDSSSRLCLVSGYEDGRIMIHEHATSLRNPTGPTAWHKIMSGKAHSQPILSLQRLASQPRFLTSSADATIAKFCLPDLSEAREQEMRPEKAVNTKHAGQQGLSVRSDGRIFATAGWDGRVRVYSSKTMKELAVLKWHKAGVYSTAFARLDSSHQHLGEFNNGPNSTVPPESASGSVATDVVQTIHALNVIKQQRDDNAQRTHWLAAGGKDGKISLWDIY